MNSIDNSMFKHRSICHSHSQISSQSSNRRKMSNRVDEFRYPHVVTREMRDRHKQKKNLNEYANTLRMQRLEAKQFENLKLVQKSTELADMNIKIKEYQQECKDSEAKELTKKQKIKDMVSQNLFQTTQHKNAESK